MPYEPNDVNQGMSDAERRLGHLKGGIITVGVGPPEAREGSEGDFTLRKLSSADARGLVLYIKYGNVWYDVGALGKSKTWDEL